MKTADFLGRESMLFGLKYICVYVYISVPWALSKRPYKKKKKFNFFPVQIGVLSKLVVPRERCMADPILKCSPETLFGNSCLMTDQKTNLLRSFKQKERYFIYNITNK